MSVEKNTGPDVKNISSDFSVKKFFLALGLGLLLCLVALFYTNKPLQLLLKLVPEQSPVQLGQISGTLAEGFTLTDLHFAQKGIKLRVNTLTAKVGWYCLGRFEICIDTATVQGVHLVLSPAAETAAQSEETLLELPKVSINQLNISDLTLHQGELQLSLNSLSTELKLGGQQIQLGETLLEQLQLRLPEMSEQQSTTVSAEAWWHYQLPELQRIELPLWLSIKNSPYSSRKSQVLSNSQQNSLVFHCKPTLINLN